MPSYQLMGCRGKGAGQYEQDIKGLAKIRVDINEAKLSLSALVDATPEQVDKLKADIYYLQERYQTKLALCAERVMPEVVAVDVAVKLGAWMKSQYAALTRLESDRKTKGAAPFSSPEVKAQVLAKLDEKIAQQREKVKTYALEVA